MSSPAGASRPQATDVPETADVPVQQAPSLTSTPLNASVAGPEPALAEEAFDIQYPGQVGPAQPGIVGSLGFLP